MFRLDRSDFVCIVFVILVIAFSSGTGSVYHGGLESAVTENDGYRMEFVESYTQHAPIIITSNGDFSSQGWPGYGNSTHPYIIEGLNITADSVCISITGTTVYFEIRDCMISSGSSSSFNGIVLDNADHGTIQNCTVDLHNNGIYLSSSISCSLINNTAVDNSDRGFYLHNAHSSTLLNNTAVDNNDGFYLYNSDDSILTNNNASSDTGYGFRLDSSDICILTNNTASTYSTGFFLYSSDSCTLTNNTATSYLTGFSLNFLDYCTLNNNTASSNVNYGIDLYYADTCTLTNNTITNTGFGVNVWLSDDCTLTSNTISSNLHGGVHLSESINCSMTYNTFVDNDLAISGESVSHWLHSVTDNTVNDKPLGYFKNLTSGTIDGSQYSQVILANCSEVTVEGGVFNDISKGVQLGYCTNCTLLNTIASGNSDYGLYVVDSVNCTLMNNTASNNFEGFRLVDSANCTLKDNTAITNLADGFNLWNSSGCTLTNNTATSNVAHGFSLDNSENCTLTYNSVSSNSECGITLESDCRYSTLYMNRLGDNGLYNGRDVGVSNNWDDGVSVGNYWKDYGGTGTYSISGTAGSVDNYPYVWDMIGAPTVDSPSDVEYSEGASGESITWSPSDDHPESYVIYREGISVKAGLWNSSSEVITISVEGLSIGTYNYTIMVTDVDDNSATDEVSVTVVDGTAPTIDSPSNVEYDEFATGYSITWDPSDLHPVDYSIYRDEILVKSGAWNSSSEVITISVDGLGIGTYNYTIIVTDIGGNIANNEVLVIVADASLPTVDSPANMEFDEFSRQNN